MGKAVQHPIRTTNSAFGQYVYKCNGCGAEVEGYYHKIIKGHVWCYECRKKVANDYAQARLKKIAEQNRIDSYNKGIDDFASFVILHMNDWALAQAPTGFEDDKAAKAIKTSIYITIREAINLVEEDITTFKKKGRTE